MIKLLKEHKSFLFYCLLITFCSGIGQTYLLALFNDSFQMRLNISAKEISFYYSGATFCASLFLPFVGRFIDRYPLKIVVVSISFVLGLSITLLGQVESVWQLVLVYILVRLLGQSSLPLCSASTISKYFGKYRGKALALASLGRSIAEGILPLLVIYSMKSEGPGQTFLYLGGTVWLLLIPTSFILLKTFKEGDSFYPENINAHKIRVESVSMMSVYTDVRTYLLSLSNVLMPFLLTGIYFHNQSVLSVKNWDMEIWGHSFFYYALSMVCANFLTGYLVDRFGAYRVVLLKFFPVLTGLGLYIFVQETWVCFIMQSLFGLSVGIAANSKNALMAELFGGSILATIKGVDSTMMVISTSLSPILFSYLIEGIGVLSLFQLLFCYAAGTGILYFFVLKSYRKR